MSRSKIDDRADLAKRLKRLSEAQRSQLKYASYGRVAGNLYCEAVDGAMTRTLVALQRQGFVERAASRSRRFWLTELGDAANEHLNSESCAGCGALTHSREAACRACGKLKDWAND